MEVVPLHGMQGVRSSSLLGFILRKARRKTGLFVVWLFWLVYCSEDFHVEVAEGLEVVAIKILDDLGVLIAFEVSIGERQGVG